MYGVSTSADTVTVTNSATVRILPLNGFFSLSLLSFFIFYLSRVEDKFSLVAEGSEVAQVAVRPSSPNLTATSIFCSSVGLPEKTHSDTRLFRVRQRGPEIVPPAVFIHKGQGEVEVPVHVAGARVLDAEKARHRQELIGRDCLLVRSYIPQCRGHDYRHGAAHPGSEIGGGEAVFPPLRGRNVGVRCLHTEEDFDDTAAGRFALRNMMNVSQFYSENMAEDITRGMLDSARKGLVMTGMPYGYYKGSDNRYVIKEDEAAIAREIFHRYRMGETTMDIAADLNRRGIKTKRGGSKTIFTRSCQMSGIPASICFRMSGSRVGCP